MTIREMIDAVLERARTKREPTREAAREVVASADRETLERLAAEYIVTAIARKHRASSLTIERKSVAPVPTKKPRRGTRRWNEWITLPENAVEAAREAERVHDESIWEARKMAALSRLVGDYTEKLRAQWTDELLATEFALRDGTFVSWGDATVEQHEERRSMYMEQASLSIDAAARQQAAIDELRASGARCLAELVRAKA